MNPPTIAALRHSAVVDFAHALVAAVLNRLLHARDSRFVVDANDDLVARLVRARDLGVLMPLRLQFDAHRLHHDGEPLDGPSLQARSLLQCLHERHVAMLAFGPHLTAEECNRLLDLLLLPQHRDWLQRERRDATLRAFGIRSVQVTLRSPADPADRRLPLRAQDLALQHYQDLAETLQHNHRLAHRDQELSVAATADAVERTLLDFDEPSLLLSLAMQDDVDRFTVGHSVRVALLALQVARTLGASREQLVHVGSAALMHDIGKSKVPQAVLFKQGRLTDDEWRYMAQHPRLGAELLLEQREEVDPRAVGAAFCHHMGPLGVGYPQPALPFQPSGTSRLVRVCDVFEALTAVRPYKRALTPIEAYAVMFRNEADFDSRWLRQFVRTLGLFPTGSRVELSNGTIGLVLAQTDRPERPRVRLLGGADGNALPAGHPEIVTVGERLDGEVVALRGIACHGRVVAVPELDADAPDVLTQGVHGACLSTSMRGDPVAGEGPCGHGSHGPDGSH